MGNCKRARTTFEKAERELNAYESNDKPAFVRWYHSTLGSQISEVHSLSDQIRNLHMKMERVVQFADLAGCSRNAAAQLYEDSPEEFERREREHLDLLQREEERRKRKLEEEREEVGQAIRDTFRAFLDSQARWISNQHRAGLSPSNLFFDLLAVFCDEYGFFPPLVTIALDHPEGAALLDQYGLDAEGDLKDEDIFEPDFDSDSDPFGHIFDTPEQSSDEAKDQARLKSLRRDLAFALHPDQSDSASDPAKLELWYEVQEALENRDLDQLEVLHAHCQMLSGDLKPQTPVSRVQALTDMYRRSRNALRRRIRALRKKPDWGFSTLEEKEREKMRRRLETQLKEQREQLRAELADTRGIYRSHFMCSSSRTTRSAEPIRKSQDHPGQPEFDFL